jgi:signal transduction histidine kinase
MRILLVEDNADHRELMRLILTGHNPTWQVDEVVSGEETVRYLAKEKTYDLVFLDYSLPGRDGLDVLEEIRRGEAPPPVVMVTGRGDEQVATEAIRGGAYDYVVKGEGYLERLPVVAQRAVEAHHLAVERRLAEQERDRYASQLLSLAQASLQVHSTLSVEDELKLIGKEARRIIGAHMSLVSLTANDDWGQTIVHASLSDKYACWRGWDETADGSGIYRLVCQTNRPMRMTQSELEAHPAWHGFGKAAGKHPPLRGWLAAPLVARDGRNIGLLMLSDKYEGDFSANDEAILVQLAAMGSVALENARLYEQVESGREQMQLLSQQVISTSEEERRRLAHELHDEAGQALTALKIKLEMTAAEMSGVFAEAVPGLREAISITDATMEQIRVLAQNLRPPSLDAVGLNAAIEGLCRNFARQTQLTIDYAGAVLPPLEGALNIMLYRVLQEALTNVAKHASAKHVQVALGLEEDTVRLSVEDDGRGFETLARAVEGGQCKGMGLLGIRERVELLGGSLEIESHPDCGTRLVVLVPCPHLH